MSTYLSWFKKCLFLPAVFNQHDLSSVTSDFCVGRGILICSWCSTIWQSRGLSLTRCWDSHILWMLFLFGKDRGKNNNQKKTFDHCYRFLLLRSFAYIGLFIAGYIVLSILVILSLTYLINEACPSSSNVSDQLMKSFHYTSTWQ